MENKDSFETIWKQAKDLGITVYDHPSKILPKVMRRSALLAHIDNFKKGTEEDKTKIRDIFAQYIDTYYTSKEIIVVPNNKKKKITPGTIAENLPKFIATRYGKPTITDIEERKQLSAGCILIREDTVLLVLNKHSNLFGIPKGYLNEDEVDLKKAALRELKEETGIMLHEDLLLPVIEQHNNTFYFTAIIEKGQLDDSYCIEDTKEIKESRWCTPEEIEQLPIHSHVYRTFVSTRRDVPSKCEQLHPKI